MKFMDRARYILFIILVIPLIESCGTNRPVVPAVAGEANAVSYIERYKDLAISEMRRTGVPASITLAQGMIESDYGRSRLAREANNHFGIKCHNGWTGPTIKHHDDRKNDCFRKYSNAGESFRDHSDFLRTGSRYSFLFDLPQNDYKGWAKGLKKAGYATNPDYANMLIRKIEENSLYYYDTSGQPASRKTEQEVFEKIAEVNTTPADQAPDRSGNSTGTSAVSVMIALPSPAARIKENNRIQYIIIEDGETAEMIEKEFQLLKWELSRYNELDNNFILVPGQMLYLQPKRDRAEPGKENHIVAEGESMYFLSQKYGIKLRKLYELNRMQEGEEVSPGQKLWLRSAKPVN